MFRSQRVATTVLVALISMPLLTELGWSKGGLSYRHGAPNGAVTTRLNRIPLETPENLAPPGLSLCRAKACYFRAIAYATLRESDRQM